MSYVISLVKSFARHEEGQDLLEYALLVALIALVAIGGVTLAGKQVDLIFNTIAGAIPA
jgi:pilus assembly protein Flp/PilA